MFTISYNKIQNNEYKVKFNFHKKVSQYLFVMFKIIKMFCQIHR